MFLNVFIWNMKNLVGINVPSRKDLNLVLTSCLGNYIPTHSKGTRFQMFVQEDHLVYKDYVVKFQGNSTVKELNYPDWSI